MVYSRYEALQILGLSPKATEEEIKTAYKNLVKNYHPDSGSDNIEAYHKVVEAYEYLEKMGFTSLTIETSRNVNFAKAPKIMGGSSSYYKIQSEREAIERRYQKQKKEEAKAYSQLLAKKRMQMEKEQKEYDAAMKAIDAVLVAEAIKTLIAKSEEAPKSE